MAVFEIDQELTCFGVQSLENANTREGKQKTNFINEIESLHVHDLFRLHRLNTFSRNTLYGCDISPPSERPDFFQKRWKTLCATDTPQFWDDGAQLGIHQQKVFCVKRFSTMFCDHHHTLCDTSTTNKVYSCSGGAL